MENNIPTAEEVFKKHEYLVRVETDSSFIENPVKRAMIEFAKIHVKLALEAALENGTATLHCRDYYDEHIIIDEQSILTAYSENMIK